MLGAGAGSRRRDDGEGAAGRRPVWLLGVVPGEPGHEPRGEDWRQVEIWPRMMQTFKCLFDFYSRARTSKLWRPFLNLPSCCLLLYRDQILEMFDHAYGSYMVDAAADLPAIKFPCCTILKPQSPHPTIHPSTHPICQSSTLSSKTHGVSNISFSPSDILPSLQKYAYPADELMPLSCRGRVRGQEPNRGDIDDSLGK